MVIFRAISCSQENYAEGTEFFLTFPVLKYAKPPPLSK